MSYVADEYHLTAGRGMEGDVTGGIELVIIVSPLDTGY